MEKFLAFYLIIITIFGTAFLSTFIMILLNAMFGYLGLGISILVIIPILLYLMASIIIKLSEKF